mgnify:CR=1 FL=1
MLIKTRPPQNISQETPLLGVIGRVNKLATRRQITARDAILLLSLVALEDLKRAVTPAAAPTYETFFVNATGAGDTEVVERVPDKEIWVIGYSLNNGGASVARVHFRSETRPISSNKDLAADGGGMVGTLHQGFWFKTAVGEALNINLASAGAVGVDVMYLVM